MKIKKIKDYLLRLPIYSYTIAYIIIPILYMFLLSFMSKAKTWGFTFSFTLTNYEKAFSPLYIGIFKDSLKLALLSTTAVILIGYPYGYFMARLNETWKKRLMILIMIPFWTSGLIRLNGWIIIFRSNGILDKLLMYFKIGRAHV